MVTCASMRKAYSTCVGKYSLDASTNINILHVMFMADCSVCGAGREGLLSGQLCSL